MKKILVMILMGSSWLVEAEASNICSIEPKQESIVQTVKWYRNSAEKNALYHQAYKIAGNYVQSWIVHNHPKVHSWGVILDIDETTLDNSWYFHQCAELAKDESDFSHYVANPQKSVALPGVVAFTQLVHKLGGYVTMVSNRDGSFKDSSGSVLDSTVANLEAQHIYFDQVVLANRRDAKNPSDKNPRFLAINSGKYDQMQMVWSNTLPGHQVIAYFGDNIQDFPKFKQSAIDALDKNDKAYNVFGNGYFIMPNPMYGSWEDNHYN